MRWFLFAAVAFFALTGCALNTEPIERTSNRGLDLLQAALEKATGELSSQSAQWIATGSLIEPGYKIKIVGGFGPTFWGESEIRIVGASGMMGTATTAGPPNRNVESFGKSKLPPLETGTSTPAANTAIALPTTQPTE